LIVVELTLINIAETGNLSYEFTILQVMWAIGWAMIALSFLMYVPWRLLLALSLAVIAGHNTLDHVTAEQFGRLSWLWDVLHVGQVPLQLSGAHTAIVIYPLIPWIFVM